MAFSAWGHLPGRPYARFRSAWVSPEPGGMVMDKRVCGVLPQLWEITEFQEETFPLSSKSSYKRPYALTSGRFWGKMRLKNIDIRSETLRINLASK